MPVFALRPCSGPTPAGKDSARRGRPARDGQPGRAAGRNKIVVSRLRLATEDWRLETGNFKMLVGAHILLYSTNPDADRTFFRDILEFRSVDVGGGWLIFKLPASELAVHPGDGAFVQKHGDHHMLGSLIYLMCDDIEATIKKLEAKQIACGPIETENWGLVTSVRLPGGGYIGLYQPTHPTALNL